MDTLLVLAFANRLREVIMIVYFDTETEMIGGKFGLAPPLITCGMIVKSENEAELKAFGGALRTLFPGQDIYDPAKRSFYMRVDRVSPTPERPAGISQIVLIFNREDTLTVFEHLLPQSHVHFVAHNTAFDIAVISAAAPQKKFLSFIHLLFTALDDSRIHCTYLRSMMETIANGGSLKRSFALKDLIKRYLHISIEKDETVRTSFTTVKHLAIRDWPQEYFGYLLDDITYLEGIFQLQESEKMVHVAHKNSYFDCLIDAPARMRAAFALYLVSCRGLKVDTDAVDNLKNTLEPELHNIEHNLVQAGFASYKKKTDGKSSLIQQNKKAIQEYLKSVGRDTLTEKGQIETTVDALAGCGNPALEALADFGPKKTVLTTYVPALMEAKQSPSKILHPRFMPFSETGRVNGREPNLLNLPRSGGIRDCFIPRDGHCFIFSDYDAAEMRTFAQALLDIIGQSKLAYNYKKDPNFDPHTYLAAAYLKITYDEALALKSAGDKKIKKTRQLMKAANFGFLGGSSAKTFLAFAENYGITDITLADAESLRSFYLSVYPEVKQYFDWVSKQIAKNKMNGDISVILPRSRRIAGNRRFTQACNVYVQGVAADGALKSLYEITKACFTPSSPLFGSRPVLFIHDEIIVESPLGKASAAAKEVQRLMQENMQVFTPDVPSTCSPAMALRWYKEAEAVYDADGNLTVWQPNTK